MKPSVNAKLVRYAASRYWKRIKSLNLSMEWDDVEQEASLVWLMAEKKFDQSKGYSFSTYFMVCARNHFNALIGCMYKPNEVEESENMEAVDDSVNPELEVHAARVLAARAAKLSNLAMTMLDMAYSPDEFMASQFEALRAKSQFTRKLNIDERFPPELNLRFAEYLLSKMGVPKKELIKARNELAEMEDDVR